MKYGDYQTIQATCPRRRIYASILKGHQDDTSQVEVLDHFIVFGQEHFDHIVSEYTTYYHERRPHQEIVNRLISAVKEEPPRIDNPEQVRCETRLGGILKHYYCAA